MNWSKIAERNWRPSAADIGSRRWSEITFMDNQNKADLQAAEAAFKRRLLDLGLLTKIATPATPGNWPRDRKPVPVAGNAVSELVIKERRL